MPKGVVYCLLGMSLILGRLFEYWILLPESPLYQINIMYWAESTRVLQAKWLIVCGLFWIRH